MICVVKFFREHFVYRYIHQTHTCVCIYSASQANPEAFTHPRDTMMMICLVYNKHDLYKIAY